MRLSPKIRPKCRAHRKGRKPTWWNLPSHFQFFTSNYNLETETRKTLNKNKENKGKYFQLHKRITHAQTRQRFLFFPPSLLMRFLFTNPIKTPLLSSILFHFPNSPRLGLLDSVRVNSPSSLTTQRSSLSMAAIPPKSPSPEEEGLARRLWIKFKRESVFAMYSPFTVCLASGNLKLETFRHYIAQDFHFLKAFAQA